MVLQNGEHDDLTTRTLRAIIDASPLAIMAFDRETKIRLWNRASEQIFGWSGEEVLGRAIPTVPAEEYAGFCAAMELVRQGQSYAGVRHRRQRKDGTPVDVAVWSMRIPTEIEGEPVVVSLVEDLTAKDRADAELRRMVEALQQSQSHYHTLFETSPTALFVQDSSASVAYVRRLAAGPAQADLRSYLAAHPEELQECLALTKLLDANRTAQQFYQGSADGPIPALSSIVGTEGAPGAIASLVAMLNGQRRFEAETINRTGNGPRHVNVRWSVVPGYEQDYNRVVVSVLDITERKAAEARLWGALQAREEMIQNVSHELRTPLSLINGYLEMLESGDLGDLASPQREAVQVARRQTERLQYMVGRLLALQAMEVGKLRRRMLQPGPWLAQALEPWALQATAAGLSLAVDLPPDLPPVLADPDYLGQVIENLLANAVKFSSEGGTICVRAWADADNLGVTVADDGIGVSPDKLSLLFERFYQVDGGSTRNYGGMGIGLALCRKIIDAHGGRIWAESGGEGQGAAFHFTLPV